MNIGVVSSAFGEMKLHELAANINRYGFRTTHLNVKKISDVDSGAGKMSPGLANYVGEAFERQGIRIPALGCYTNLIHPHEETRRNGIQRLKEQLRFARDFGASVVATETGTLNIESQFEGHPDNQSEANWKLLREVVRDLAEEAEKWGVHLALEGYTNNVVNTPERMSLILQETPLSCLGIVMDPCNYIDEGNMEQQEAVMDSAFEKLGDRILLAHAKDFRIENGKMIQPAAGTGGLNYTHYLDGLLKIKPHVHLFLEHLTEKQMHQTLGFVMNHLEVERL